MAGYAVAVFKPVQRKRARGVAIFVELFKVIAVAVAVGPAFEYARVERHHLGTVLVQEVGAEGHKAHIFAAVHHVLHKAYYAVDHIVPHFAVDELLPVILRANQLFAARWQSGKAAVGAYFVVYLCPRLVYAAYNLVGLQKVLFSVFGFKPPSF